MAAGAGPPGSGAGRTAAAAGRLRMARALLLDRNGRWQEALAAADRCIADEPASSEALNFWGFVAADHAHELHRARQRIRAALSFDPGSGAILDSLGWAHLQSRRARQAARSSWSRRRAWSPKIRRSCPTWPSCTAQGASAIGARAAAQGAGRASAEPDPPAQDGWSSSCATWRRQRRRPARGRTGRRVRTRCPAGAGGAGQPAALLHARLRRPAALPRPDAAVLLRELRAAAAGRCAARTWRPGPTAGWAASAPRPPC